ncbi:MAG TPA: site-specific integrase [Myxococcota bacterium]|nr:site-specific integrase [Myxococcota bacterium]
MPYQYVREPLTAEESDRLSNACETSTERLVVWTLLDTGLRVGELCDLTPKNVLWQQRQLRVKGKGGSFTAVRPRFAWCRCRTACGRSWSTISRTDNLGNSTMLCPGRPSLQSVLARSSRSPRTTVGHLGRFVDAKVWTPIQT